MSVTMTLGYADAMQALVLNIHGLPDGESAMVVVEDYDLPRSGNLAREVYDRTAETLRDGTAKGERRWVAVKNAPEQWSAVFKQLPRPKYPVSAPSLHWAQRSAA